MSDLAFNWASLSPNVTNQGLFKIIFLFVLAHRAKMNRKLILKSSRFVPNSAKLAKLKATSDISARKWSLSAGSVSLINYWDWTTVTLLTPDLTVERLTMDWKTRGSALTSRYLYWLVTLSNWPQLGNKTVESSACNEGTLVSREVNLLEA